MPRHRFLILFALLAGVLVAQEPDRAIQQSAIEQSSAKSDLATKEFAALNARQRDRLRELSADDADAQKAAQAARIAELDGFLREFGDSREANRVRMEIGQAALGNAAHRQSAHAALAGFDATATEAGAGIMAARLAGKLEFQDVRKRLMAEVTAGAKTIRARIELANMLRRGMKEEAWADDVVAATEKMVTTDEQKAELLLSRADLTRSNNGKDRSAYDQALAELAAKYPETASGRLARDKLAAAALTAGSEPIAIHATDLDGKPVSLADYRGKVLLMDFWATWCAPCMKEMPHIVAMHRTHHEQGLEVLGISLDRAGARDKLDRVLAASNMDWRQVYDGGHWHAEVAQHYDVASIPFTVLIGRDGLVVGTGLHGEQLEAAVKQALAAK